MILKNRDFSFIDEYFYCRLLCLESHLAQNADLATDYAMFVLQGRFKAAEAAIAKNIHYSSDYAFDVIKERFPAGEALIFRKRKGNIAIKQLARRYRERFHLPDDYQP